jgi:hypothetical protein
MQLNTFEKVVVITILVIGLIGGVLLVNFQQPPIVSSIFIALGIATVVYHFLGGIEVSEFNMGPVKLGGSIAALIGSAWFINGQLNAQTSTSNQVILHASNLCYDEYGNLLGELPFNDYQIGLNALKQVTLNDSIKIGNLDLGQLQLNESFAVLSKDEAPLGTLANSELSEIGMFTDLEMSLYTEIKYKLHLAEPYRAQVDQSHWRVPHQSLRGRYADLPFTVTPGYLNNGERTIVDFKEGTTPIITKLLERDQPFLVHDPNERTVFYFIRVRNLIATEDPNTFDNSVIYQIFGFEGSVN